MLTQLTASGWYFRALLWGGNFHTVIAGEVYRSAQPEIKQLDQLIGEWGLQSIVSLRGGKDHWNWFAEEKRLGASRNVDVYGVHLSPNRLPSQATLQKLIEVLDRCRRPVLLHCKPGIDRSGLAAAVAELLAGTDPDQALGQFALKYGYVALAGHSDLPKILTGYQAWLDQHRQKHTPAAFRQWVNTVYVPYFYAADLELLEYPRELAMGQAATLCVRATNASPQPWQFRSSQNKGVHLGMIVSPISDPIMLASHESKQQPAQELRGGYVDQTVLPQQSIEVALALPPFSKPGHYRLRIDLVDEGVSWFADMGSQPLEIEITVVNHE